LLALPRLCSWRLPPHAPPPIGGSTAMWWKVPGRTIPRSLLAVPFGGGQAAAAPRPLALLGASHYSATRSFFVPARASVRRLSVVSVVLPAGSFCLLHSAAGSVGLYVAQGFVLPCLSFSRSPVLLSLLCGPLVDSIFLSLVSYFVSHSLDLSILSESFTFPTAVVL
jgi:hypothetical protein